MTLTREACKEDSMESSPQDLPPKSDPQAKPSGITEEPVPVQETEVISDTSSPYNGYGTFQLGKSNQVIHFNSV